MSDSKCKMDRGGESLLDGLGKLLTDGASEAL